MNKIKHKMPRNKSSGLQTENRSNILVVCKNQIAIGAVESELKILSLETMALSKDRLMMIAPSSSSNTCSDMIVSYYTSLEKGAFKRMPLKFIPKSVFRLSAPHDADKMDLILMGVVAGALAYRHHGRVVGPPSGKSRRDDGQGGKS